MAEGKLGEIYVDIVAKSDKLKQNLNNITKESEKSAKKIETDFKQLRLDFDTRFAKMNIQELSKIYKVLKIQMEQKLKFNTDEKSLERTAVAMDAVRSRMSKIKDEGIATGNKITEVFLKLAVAIGGIAAIKKVFNFTEEGLFAITELKDLQEGFEGTARDLHLMKKATAGMVDDGDLLKLSNQAAGFNVKIKDQPILFLLATKAAKSMGGSIGEGFDAIMRATDGMSRGVGKLVGGRVALNQEVERLARLEGGKLSELDAEVQKRIKIQAIINASHLSMEDVEKNQATQNQQLRSLPALIHEVKEAWGLMFISILSKLPFVMKGLEDLARNFREVAQGRAGNAAETVQYVTTKIVKGKEVPKTELDREKDITDFQASGLRAYSDLLNLIQTRKKGGKVLLGDEYDQEKLHLEIKMATFAKLIELAKKYKGAVTEKGGGTLSEEAILARKEKEAAILEKYHAIVKEDVEDEIALKMKMIDEDYAKLSESAKKTVDLEKWKQEEIKKIRESYEKNLFEEIKKSDAYKHSEFILAIGEAKQKQEVEDFKRTQAGYIFGGGLNERGFKGESTPFQRMIKNINDEIDNTTKGAEQFANTLSGGFGDAIMQGENLGNVLQNIAAQLAGAVIQAGLFAAIMSVINPSSGTGFLGFFGKALGFGAQGGSFVNGSKIAAFAGGGSMTVPYAGIGGDYYPILAKGGERVDVTPNYKVGDQEKVLGELVGRVEALTMATIKSNNKKIVIPLYLNQKLIAEGITQQQNDFERNNIQVSR